MSFFSAYDNNKDDQEILTQQHHGQTSKWIGLMFKWQAGRTDCETKCHRWGGFTNTYIVVTVIVAGMYYDFTYAVQFGHTSIFTYLQNNAKYSNTDLFFLSFHLFIFAGNIL